MEREKYKILTDKIEIVRVNLPYYVEKCYNEDELDYKDRFIGIIGIEDKEKLKSLTKGDKSMENKKLYRSQTNKKLAGVCGGLAEHFGLNASAVRIVFILLLLQYLRLQYMYHLCSCHQLRHSLILCHFLRCYQHLFLPLF